MGPDLGPDFGPDFGPEFGTILLGLAMADEATPASDVKKTRMPESRLPDRMERIAHSRYGLSDMVRRRPGAEFTGP